MPPAELQRFFGLVFEPAAFSSTLLRHRLELPLPAAYHFDDGMDLQTSSYDSLWIDMGGEG